MIDIRTEHLLPVEGVPDYLESRGVGKRVSMRAVRRWIAHGCNGARLDVVRIDKAMLTSLEALQRWVERQSSAIGVAGAAAVASGASPQESCPEDSSEHLASLHLLTEHRVLPTDLDRLIDTLDHPESTRAFAAGILFRMGLRTPEDARRQGLERLLAIKGLGRRSHEVVRSLWNAMENGHPSSRAPTDEKGGP